MAVNQVVTAVADAVHVQAVALMVVPVLVAERAQALVTAHAPDVRLPALEVVTTRVLQVTKRRPSLIWEVILVLAISSRLTTSAV